MEEVAHSFYNAAPIPPNEDLMDQVLSKVPSRVLVEMNRVICRELRTSEELHRAPKELAKGKAHAEMAST